MRVVKKKLKSKKNVDKSVDKSVDLVDKLEQELEDEGIVAFTNENVMTDYLVLPMDLTEVVSRELGRYFGAFTNQKMYVRGMLGRVKALLKQSNSELDEIKAGIFATCPVKMSIKEKELKLLENSKAKDILNNVYFLEEKANTLNLYLLNIEDAITCLSREITRRENDMFHNNREDNMDNRRRR